MKNIFIILMLLIMLGTVFEASPKEKRFVIGANQYPSLTAPLRLEDLERMALELNPAIAQAESLVRAAAGRKTQAGLYPNPVFGYEAEEFSLASPGRRSQNYLFLEQRIKTGGKLNRQRDVWNAVQSQSETELEIQKMRLLNTVRSHFYRTLGAQEIVNWRQELAKIARQAVDISEQLFNLGQADKPDLLAAEVEAQKVELDLLDAENKLERSWRALAAVVGNPELPRANLMGVLEPEPLQLNPEEFIATLLQKSPEIKLVRNQIDQAKASLYLAKAQRSPDILLKGGLGYSYEAREIQAVFQVGVALPLFDRNQGSIAAAAADLDAAQLEAKRVELILRSRFDSVYLDYMNAKQRVERYGREIIPRAQKAYDLYLDSFQEMTAAYPQVLIAQRTLFQSKTDYIEALVGLRLRLVAIQGLVLSGSKDFLGDISTDEPEEKSLGLAAGKDRWR